MKEVESQNPSTELAPNGEAEPVDIGIEPEGLNQVAQIMDQVLADEFLLFVKVLNYHWNVFGLQFRELHKFFEEQYLLLAKVIDEVAERTRALGERPICSLGHFLEQSRIEEDPGTELSGAEMVKALLADHEFLVRELRRAIEHSDEMNDLGASDFLTELMGRHEKLAWMHRALLS